MVYVVPGAGIICDHIKTPCEEIEPVAAKPVTSVLASPVTLAVPNDDVIPVIVFVVKKLPRADALEYDWRIFADNRYVNAGRQIEQNLLTL